MLVHKDFVIEPTTVVCPACNSLFSTPNLVTMPPITKDTPIETDLHRVLPEGGVRAALVAMCAACSYTWWSTAFATTIFKPGLVPATPLIDHPKKFAHAVLTGRQNRAHALDLALLALNGYWCAREAEMPHERWLDLAGQELDKALRDDSWQGNRGYHHYVMGEVCRLSGDFKGAVRHFDRVTKAANLPAELVERQRVVAVSGDARPTLLPPHLVETMFCAVRPLEAGRLSNE